MYRNHALLACVLGLFFAIETLAKHPDTAKADKIFVRVDTSKSEPWTRRLNGFNTNMISGLYAYGDAELRRQTAPLMPSFLRFPGGTIGNFFRWEKRGFEKADMAATSSDKLNKRNVRNLALLQKRRNGVIDFDDFVALCKEVDAQAIVVSNVLTGTPQESAAWVQYVKQKGYAIAGWELGNEIYLPFYRNRFASIDAYIDEAKRHAAAMRAVDPLIRLAVPVHAAGFHLHRSSRYAKNWNRRLAEETFYDAYVVHTYLRPQKYLKQEQIPQFELTRNDLFALSEASFRQATTYYKALFGNREMWLTEWNLAEQGKPLIADTLLHGLYVADFIIQLINSELPIAYAGYNTLAGRWNGFPSFTPTDHRAKRAESSVRRASYYALELFGDPLRQASRRHSIEISDADHLTGSRTHHDRVSAVSATALGTQGTLFIPLVNRSDKQLSARLVIDGEPALNPKSYHILSGSRLDDRGGDNELVVKRLTLDGPEFLIPALSLGVIEAR